MRKYLLLATLLLAHAAHAAPACTSFGPGNTLPTAAVSGPVLCNQGYAVQYSPATKTPVWSAEHLTQESIEQAQALPGREHFLADLRIGVGERAELADYKRSGWSRGHMTPSGDMPDRTSRAETYLLSNVVPQSAALNDGAWNQIERATRALAEQDGEIYVVTGPGWHDDRGTIGRGRIRVPSSVWKVVYDPAEHATAAIVCKNTDRPTCTQVPLAAVVHAVGVDPFPGVSAGEAGRSFVVRGWPG